LIGTQYLDNLATSSHETLVFLKLLERDLQDQIACNSCRKLHRMQDAKKYDGANQRVWTGVELDCVSDNMKASVTSFIHDNFSTVVFKMAMKHYHHFGYDARSRRLLNILSEKFRSHSWGTWVKTQQAECHIKNGSLFTCKSITFRGTCTGAVQGLIFFWICPHLKFESRSIGGSASLRIRTSSPVSPEEKWSMLLHCENSTNIDKTSWNLSWELQQCRHCRTEYKVGFKHGDGCNIKFTTTIWKDLGQGPETEEWRAHLPLKGRRITQTNSVPRGEIASVFQGGGGGGLGRR
jgi:hypothetical protein